MNWQTSFLVLRMLHLCCAQDFIDCSEFSNLFSIQQILQAVFDYPTGTISDKIGRKKIMGYGFIVWGTGILLYAFAVNFWTFLPAMVFMALGLALISGAPSAWLVDQMIRHGIYEERNQILPKLQAGVRFFAIAASLASYFWLASNQRLPIITAGCISIGAGIVALLFGQDNYGRVKGNNIFRMLQLQAKSFIKEEKLLLLSLRTIVCHVPFVAFVLFWQIYATEVIHIETKYLAFFLLVFMVLLMLGNYAVSIFTRKISNLGTSIAGIIIMAVSIPISMGYAQIAVCLQFTDCMVRYFQFLFLDFFLHRLSLYLVWTRLLQLL